MKKVTCILLALSLLAALTACAEQAPDPTETLSQETTQAPTQATTEPPATETVPPATVVTEPPTEPTVASLDESWFDDALFIGESRTMGLQAHGRLGDADYFCAECLTVYGVLGIQTSDKDFTEQTLESLLSSREYGKVYIHLGINELGGNLDTFAAQYQKLIDLVREKQPDAYIILQAVMGLGEGYSSKPAFSRESIQALNDKLRTLAEGEMFRFSDVNQLVTDESGYLIEELTFDGCHLYATGYQMWGQWLLEEAASFDIP